MFDCIAFTDLEFNEMPVTAYSTAGTPYTRFLRTGMPKIPQKILDSIIYLYPSKEDAIKGKNYGGTGFLIGFASEHIPQKRHLYAVTNWHVACRDGASVIRMNTRNSVDAFEFDPAEWFFDSSYDIAVIPLDESALRAKEHRATILATELFMTRELVDQSQVGSGDDIFMVGRFIDHDGKETNQPAVRFGNISVMPVSIIQPNDKPAHSYIIDCHSRTGFSGSPVFIYRTPGYDLDDRSDNDKPLAQRRVLMAGTNMLGLLGIHWGQFPEPWEIADKKKLKESAQRESLIIDGKYIKGVSGMTCVLPAWKILEVLDMPKLKEKRLKQDQAWEDEDAKKPLPPVAESESRY